MSKTEVSASDTDVPISDARCSALRSVYEELCKSHDNISDFRAKLLALLPLASGTGLFAVLNIENANKSAHLLAIGIFGAFVAFALYMYEMRGIQRCHILSRRARKLEERLIGTNIVGAFSVSPAPRFFLATNTWAARIIYPATISVWVYVAFCGAPAIEALRVPLSLVCFIILLLGGHFMIQSKSGE